MTDQHRATPEQWAAVEEWATSGRSDAWYVVLELRDRVEALEKAQQVGDSAECRAAPARSLVERVAAAITNGVICDHEDGKIARAAIREVAAWLRESGDNIAIADAMVLEQEANR